MKRLFKYFKYDFLDKNKGIQSAIAGIVYCLMFIITKQIVQYIGAYSIVVVIVCPIVLLGGLALLDKQLSRKNFSDSQLSLANKVGFGIYYTCFIATGFIIYWR